MDIKAEMKKQQEDDEKWGGSMEGIVYNLKVIGDETDNSSSEEIAIIAKTLQKLPKDIRQEVLDEVIFVVFSGSHGVACNLYSSASMQPLILLDFGLMRNEGKNKARMMDTVAHEIGHYISGYMGMSSDPGCEKKADDLAEKWGFKRYYDNYKEFEGLAKNKDKVK